ncbi:MAG: tetratricopeptide repeat-containing protein [Pseudomonadota bacterium]
MAETIKVKPFCFMIMPFSTKATLAEPGKGPAYIDFNALWDKAYFPLLNELGYQPVRADQETGSLIINQMLERLYFSDLVLADMTIPNGNVYYEVGLRHAARKDGCVLLAADWSRQLFDVAQMRTVRYPLISGDIDDATAQAVRDALRPAILKMKTGASPFFEALPGYPGAVDERQRAGVRDQTEMLAAFQAQMRSLRSMPRSLRLADARKRIAEGPITVPSVAISVLRLLVSAVKTAEEWDEVLVYIATLAADIAQEPYVSEIKALALGKAGQPQGAIAQLLEVIDRAGNTSERQGLIGGRYQQLMRASTVPDEIAHFRNQAIAHYEQGMMLDLNDYYPSSNLPRLYRARAAPGDESRAQMALQVTIAACERAMLSGSIDEWVRPTLLGAAFDVPDPDKSEALADQIASEGRGAWQLDSTLISIEPSIAHVRDEAVKARLRAVLERLKTLA